MTGQTSKTSNWVKTLALWAVCAGLGYLGGTYLAQQGMEFWPRIGVDSVLALSIAGIYVVLGAIMLALRYFPGIFSSGLSQEDAADIEDQPRLFALQSVSMLVWGLALVLLTLAGDGGPLDPGLGAVLVGGSMAIGAWTYWRSLPLLDELHRATTLEAGVIAYGMVLIGGGGWAALAHLDLIEPPTMLALVSLFWGLALIATVLAAARRGMLQAN